MIKVIRVGRTGTEVPVFFTAPEFQTELNAQCAADRRETAFYSDSAGTNGGHALNTTAWD